MKINLSIIIISYNTKDITRKCIDSILRSLKDSTIKTQIIVLDNNSTDGSSEMLKKYQEVTLIESRENLGFAKGNNEAVKKAEGDVLLFLNSDTVAIDDAIPQLYTYFTGADNSFQFIGAKLLEKDGESPQDSAGPFYSLPIAFAALFLKADYYHVTRYSPDQTKEVDWVSGACIMCKKTDYERLSGFDEKIFMYMDEVDLLYRAKKESMRVGFYPNARFIHLGSASAASRTQPILQVYKGFIYFYKKHHPGLQLSILKGMLQLKAALALLIGTASGNRYLIETYEKAWHIARDN